jgi:cytosine/adenosine deaminase-related metal-dependent hydrolase
MRKNLTPHDIYIGALLGAAEMLINGVTTVFYHYFEMQEVYTVRSIKNR